MNNSEYITWVNKSIIADGYRMVGRQQLADIIMVDNTVDISIHAATLFKLASAKNNTDVVEMLYRAGLSNQKGMRS